MHDDEGKNRPDPTIQSKPSYDPYSPTELDPKRAFEMGAESVELPNPLYWMPPEPEELASLFPEYKIEHLLGRGGMGAVYKAIQIILDRFVAIKLLPPELARADPNFAERFHKEAKAMAALNHQNIVTVYNFGKTTAGHYYFVMEFVDGMDFHKLIHSGQLSEAGALNAVSQICDALEYAHDQGYVHRDIKPANIFINQKGILKIGDFGLAKIAKGNPQDYTQSNMIMGSLFYSAPEQVEGRPVDRRADIYSLGVMFYEMLTRDLPRGNFPLPSERVQIDVRLDHVVLKAMASKPELRYATATDLRTEVDVIRTTQRQPQSGAQSVPAKPDRKIAKRGKKTSLHLAIITSLLGLLVVVIGIAVFTQWPGASPSLKRLAGPATGSVAENNEAMTKKPATSATATREVPFVNSLGMKFVPVPITGGASDGRRILFSVWETRVQDYRAFAEAAKRVWPAPEFLQAETHPAVNISWEDATAFCAWLNERDRAAGWIGPSDRYRLPSDHEWSCAVGIGHLENPDASPKAKNGKFPIYYPWGEGFPPPVGAGNYYGKEMEQNPLPNLVPLSNYEDGFIWTAPVGSFAVNKFGLYDLGGNVTEWCDNWFEPAKPERRVLRGGGAWGHGQGAGITSSRRDHAPPSFRLSNNGFRSVLETVSSPDFSTSSPSLPTEAGTSNASASSSRPVISSGSTDGWIDLLALVDPEKDTLSGKWTRVADGLHGEKLPEGKGGQYLQLPYEVPEEYDFRITLTHLFGNCDATQILCAGDRHFVWCTASGQSDKWAGFNMINGKPMMLNGAGVKLPGPREVNRRYESLVEVRRDRVTGYVVGQKLVEWKTNYRDITPDPGYIIPNPKALGVGIWWSKTVFHEIAVREVTGEGKVLRNAAEPPSSTMTFTATKDKPFINSLGMKFVPVPIFGGPTDGKKVLFSVWETRVQDYEAFVKATNHIRKHAGFPQGPTHPAVTVTWEDAVTFCQWLTDQERQAGRISMEECYRLPFDHEWSCAVGIGSREDASKSPAQKSIDGNFSGVYPWGTSWPPPDGTVNFGGEELGDFQEPNQKVPRTGVTGHRDGFPRSAPVGSFPADGTGLFDLGGNVREWCFDLHVAGDDKRVLRGGAFLYSTPDSFLSTSRSGFPVGGNWRSDVIGFRVVLAPVLSGIADHLSLPQTPIPSKDSEPNQPVAEIIESPYTNTLGMKFVPVPITGGPSDGKRVLFSVWETRVQDYEAFVKETNRARPAPDFAQTGLHPVVNLRYEDAVAFCAWLTEKERKADKVGSRAVYRLPSDHEWSCAVGLGRAEAPTKTPEAKNWAVSVYPWGRQFPPPPKTGNYHGEEAKGNPAAAGTPVLAGYNDGFERTAPVGSFAANELGLHDLGGNVSEWCEDWFDGVKATKRVLRGASWGFHYSNDLLSSNRYGVEPNFWNLDVGFRVVLDPGAKPDAVDADTPVTLTPLSNIAEAAFIPLLETPQLAGWREHGPGGGASVADSVVTLKPGRNFSGVWWYAARTFSDLQLRLQFRLATPGANSGVMLRFALPDENINKHYDVDISNDPNPMERTGAIMFVKAPTANPQKDGEWNDLDITATGQSYRVLVNGILVNEYTGGRSTSGYIGLQLGRGTVQIRQLRIKDLSAPPLSINSLPNSDAAAKVVQLRSDFQAEAKLLDIPILALNTKYREYLETQKTAFQQAGNLKGVLAVEDELNRFEGAAAVTNSSFSELRRLQEIYYQQKTELRQKKQEQFLILVRNYRQKAEDMASESTKAGRIEEAKLALAESDRFTAMEKEPASQSMMAVASGAGVQDTKELTNSLGMKFVPVPGTEVLFCIHEVRWKDYAAYAKENPAIASNWKNQTIDGFAIREKAEDHPVVFVNWEEANAFCTWLSKKEGRTYRLPTDHEWSLAVGIGKKEDQKASPAEKDKKIEGEYPWGSEWPPPQGAGNYSDQRRKANAPKSGGGHLEGYDDGFPTTAPVMSFKPNQYGLYDLGGNVWEWVENKPSQGDERQVARGGSLYEGTEIFLRSSKRGFDPPSRRIDITGFRCVVSAAR